MVIQTAGIVCYTIENNRLYFLLGREQFVPGWLCSHQWSEPGGHAKKIDKRSIMQTALREFHEESLGTMPEVTSMMEEALYTALFQVHRQHRRKRGKSYFLLYKSMRWNVQTEFHVRREQLKGIQQTLHKLQTIQKNLISANAPAPETIRRVNDRLQVIQDIVGYQELLSAGHGQVEISCICPTAMVYFRYPRSDESCIITITKVDVPFALTSLYMRMLSLKQLLIKQIEGLPEYLKTNAIAEAKAPMWLPHVRREYLEKDRLQWIEAGEILNHIGDGWCRPGFEVPFQLMIKYLANEKANENSSCPVSGSESPVLCSAANSESPF